MVYVDLDGVLANLYDYISVRLFQQKFSMLNEFQIPIFRSYFREKTYFEHSFPEGAEAVFERLEPFPFNEILIKTVIDFAGEYCILSRPCKLDLQGTKRAKLKWVEKNLSFCPPKDVFLVQDKSANNRPRESILIDDWDEFLIRWQQKGGTSIKFDAKTFNTSNDVRTYLKNQFALSK